jgi:anaerobic selenocysteine-containing dehydrogenase
LPNQVSTDFHICIVLVAEHATYGPMIMHEIGPDHLNSNCMMLIGANPLAAHPAQGQPGSGVKESQTVVVDPRHTELALGTLCKSDGTDAALPWNANNHR